MAIDREYFNGPITFCCDNCGELDETRCSNFSSALAKAKSHGWKVRKNDDDWTHLCYDCEEIE